jgi:hypothetical protein
MAPSALPTTDRPSLAGAGAGGGRRFESSRSREGGAAVPVLEGLVSSEDDIFWQIFFTASFLVFCRVLPESGCVRESARALAQARRRAVMPRACAVKGRRGCGLSAVRRVVLKG